MSNPNFGSKQFDDQLDIKLEYTLIEGDYVDGQRLNAYHPDRLSTAVGTPPSYSARAWVDFNGNNGAIRAQQNVSSITRHGVANYQVNFATAMPNANYCAAIASDARLGSNSQWYGTMGQFPGVAPTASNVRVGNGGIGDFTYCSVVIFK